MIKRHVVPNVCGLANDDATAMVNKKTLAYGGAGVNVDICYQTGEKARSDRAM